MAEIGLEGYRQYEAVDAKNLTWNDEIEWVFRRNNFGSKMDVIACALSHVSVWRTIVEEQLPWALILEDDVKLAPNFRNDWAATLEFLNDDFGSGTPGSQSLIGTLGWGGATGGPWEYVCIGPKGSFEEYVHFDDEEVFPGLFRYRERHLCYAHAYALSLSGATKLVNWVASKGIYCGLDWYITEHYHLMNSFACSPSLAAQQPEVSGDISH